MTRVLRTFVRRLRGSTLTASFEHRMDAELRHHLQLETEAYIDRGLSPGAAREAALRAFGSLAAVKDDCRDSWGMRVVDQLAQDLRFGVRHLLKYRGYTIIVLLTLALGIGANTAIFSVVHAVLLRPLPFAYGDRLVEIRQQALAANIEDANLSAKEVADYRSQAAALDGVVEYHRMSFNLLGRGEASRVRTAVVSANYFDVLGIRPLLGRTFVADDDAKDAPPVLVLTYDYWQHTLGGDPGIIGRTFEMNDKVHTVIGVLPPIPEYPAENDMYMPVSACPFRSSPAMAEDRSMRMVSAIGRLRPGVTVARARADMAVIAARMVAAYPKDYQGAAAYGFTATALSIKEELTRRARPTLLALLAVTGFVLLLVAANVANLTLTRLIGRDRELALRSALGAGRGRIARQLLTEQLLLALGGGALGLLFAWSVRSLLVAFAARFTPRAAEIAIDPVVLAFAATVSILTGLLFGIVPAWSRRDADADGLRAGHRTVGRGPHARHVLVAAQIAISFVLLVGAGLLVRSFRNLAEVDTGFNADHVLTMRVNLDWVKYSDEAKRRTFYEPLLEKIAAAPGVKSAALGLTVPLDDAVGLNQDFVIEGRTPANGQARPTADIRLVTPDYFRTIGTAVLQGRPFTAADRAESPGVAIVNRSMARHNFPDGDAIGRRISFDLGKHWMTIVGTVNDTRDYGLDKAATDQIYGSFFQNGPLSAAMFVRTAGDPMAAAQTVQQIVRAIDPRQPLSKIQTLAEVRNAALASPKVMTLLVSLFAVVALLVTAAGIIGVVGFSVRQRTTEIGVRMALGAQRSEVVAMIVKQALAPVAIGLAAGFAGAIPLARTAGRLLFEVQPTDVPTIAAASTLLAAVALAACMAPARRAAGIDPMHALRAE